MMKNLWKTAALCLTICAVTLSVVSCKKVKNESTTCGTAEEGILRVGMECTYAPYNWTQSSDANGAVKLKGSADYAYGYDVIMAKYIAEKLGLSLEVVKTEWDSLPPAVQSGALDCAIAGQSITSKRLQTVDFTKPYYFATIVTLVKADGKYADAKGLSDLNGAKATSQINTIWYDSCLPQIPNVDKQTAQSEAPQMIVALDSGAVEVVVTDMPTAMAAIEAYSSLKLLDFNGTDNNYQVSQEEINIGISVRKNNKTLTDKINSVLDQLTEEDFTKWMQDAIKVQPLSK